MLKLLGITTGAKHMIAQAAIAVFGLLMNFIVPLKQFLFATFVLVMVDLYTGIRAARKRKEAISSKGLRNSLKKIVDYFVAILLTELVRTIFFYKMDFEIAGTQVNITYITAMFIAVIELKSNMENLEATTGAPIWSFIKKYLPDVRIKRGQSKKDGDGNNSAGGSVDS